MIDTLFLANKIQEVLNQNKLGVDFLIFDTTGDFVNKKRVGAITQKYVQGVLEKVTADTVPIKNISFRVINTQLILFVDYFEQGFFETENGRQQSKNVETIQQILYDNLYQLSGQTITMEEGGKNYNVTIAMSEAVAGEKTSLGDIADLVPLYVDISFTIFENGINNNDVRIYLNNEEIFFTRLVIMKKKTADQSTFANDKKSKVYILQGGKSIDVSTPVLNSKFHEFIYEDLMGDELNKPVSVVIESPLGDYAFIGVLGDITQTGDVGKNLNYNFAVVQGVEKILNYDSGWETKTATGTNFTYSKTDNKLATIHWGDGSYLTVSDIGTYTHTYSENKLHYVRIYRG